MIGVTYSSILPTGVVDKNRFAVINTMFLRYFSIQTSYPAVASAVISLLCASGWGASPRPFCTTNRRLLRKVHWISGGFEVRVTNRRIGIGAGLLAAATALGLAGCANVDLDNKQAWFSKKADFFGHNSGYTFSELQDSRQHQRQATANDYVDETGACPPPVAAAAPPPAPGANPAANPAATPVSADPTSQLGGGIALGMTECDVVGRAGRPSNIQIGKAPNGDRLTTLTFNAPPRPGIYRFQAGLLIEMDRVAQPAAPAPAAAKKKSTKSARQNDQS